MSFITQTFDSSKASSKPSLKLQFQFALSWNLLEISCEVHANCLEWAGETLRYGSSCSNWSGSLVLAASQQHNQYRKRHATIWTHSNKVANLPVVITEFYQALDDAPSELSRLKTKVLLVRDSLITLRNLSGDLGQENLITSDLQDLLRTAIDTVAAAVVRSQQACRYAGDKNRARRLRWALIERHRMEELSKALSKAGEGLNLVLEILNM
jgi:hypothetical protein